ncbi:chemotaxis protein CheB [Methylobacterium soli]|uniref:protein-glutamate methylesterase n=2 Tax=Methylobacterium soli TaxID=553447 RepID=A0A6L3SZ23_9HYPH|nr:chemotaxis protein CheB [Methylobacterium soli]
MRAMDPWTVAIGSSGGRGLDDLTALLTDLPPLFAAVVLVVLHRPPDRISHLQAVLARTARIPVVVALQGEHFEAGTAYIGDPDDHLILGARTFGALVNDPTGQYRNRTIDLLFHSVAQHGGERIIGVVLSGALDDGSRGLAAIRRAGGITMVMAPSGWVWQGMPENAIAYDGGVDLIGDSREIARAIVEIVRDGPARLRAEPPVFPFWRPGEA